MTMNKKQNKLIHMLNLNISDGLTSMEKAAKETEISLSALYNYRAGKRIINVEQYAKLENYLNNLNK